MKILIVDDSTFARNVHKQLLLSVGDFTLIEAASGEECLQKFREEKPDMAIIDLLMPDMDGSDVIRQIRQIDPEAKVIICSTDRQRFRQEEATKLGVMAFLTKPLSAESLSEALERLMS